MNSLAKTHQRNVVRLRKIYPVVDTLELLLVVNEAVECSKVLHITVMRKFGGFSSQSQYQWPFLS